MPISKLALSIFWRTNLHLIVDIIHKLGRKTNSLFPPKGNSRKRTATIMRLKDFAQAHEHLTMRI